MQQQNLDATEEIAVLEVTPEEFWAWVEDGTIRDASTLTTALYAVLGGHLSPPRA